MLAPGDRGASLCQEPTTAELGGSQAPRLGSCVPRELLKSPRPMRNDEARAERWAPGLAAHKLPEGSDDDPPMWCPLCAGPLTEEDLDRFVCAVGHTLSRDELRRAANERANMALWMAIEALGSEAKALRRLAGDGGGNDRRWTGMADQADEDARLLRGIADAHHPLLGPEEPARNR